MSKSQTLFPVACGAVIFLGLLSAGSRCHAQYCHIKNAAETCKERMGLDWDTIDSCINDCPTLGAPCVPGDEYKQINSQITQAIYEKNRATGVSPTIPPNGYATAIPNSVICGKRGTCGPTCSWSQYPDGTFGLICAPQPEDVIIYFYDLSNPCNT